MSEKVINMNKKESQDVERKIDVKEFCRRYDMAKTDDAKQKMLESIIIRKYCPVLEKKIILQTMLNKTVVTTPNGISHVDYFLSKINMVTATLIIYTKINTAKSENSETTAFDDYDMLHQRNLMELIWNIIGQDELDELLNINSLLLDNYMEENKTADAYISKYINALASTIGVFANEGLQDLIKIIADNKEETSINNS